MKYLPIKTLSDYLLAIVLLIVFLPVMLFVSILIKLEDPKAPVIFTQSRLGKDRKEFKIYKFRSMRTEQFKNGRLLTDTERISFLGKVLRKTSVDELPQLFNILKGEMSFIGPRPLPSVYLPYFTDRENQRHTIKPGISGWAQVNGRTNVLWEQKFELDLYYLQHLSFTLDIKILYLTVKKVFAAADILDSTKEVNQNFDEYRLENPVEGHLPKEARS